MKVFKPQLIEISFWTIFKVVIVGVLAWSAWILRDIIGVLLLAIVIASAIEPMTQWFMRYKIPRVLSVLIIYLLAFLSFSITFYLLIPPLFGDLLDFVSTLPQQISNVLRPDGIIFSLFPALPSTLNDLLMNFVSSLEETLPQITSGFFSAGSHLVGGLLSFSMLIVISFYLSVQERGIENFLRIVTPLEHERYILDLWQRSQQKIGRWMQGQMLLGLLVGVLVYLGLTVLQVKYALLLAILTAMFELIPVFGPIMAAIPAIAVASIQGPFLALLVTGLYIIIQQLENHLIYPLVVRKTVGVPPLLVVLSLIVGGTLGGFFGIILAVPIASILVELLDDLAKRKHATK